MVQSQAPFREESAMSDEQMAAESAYMGSSEAYFADNNHAQAPDPDSAYQAREDARHEAREKLFANLNPQQFEAVSLPKEASVLILAGAGSGKTSVITARIAKLIELGTPSSEILAVTFTNKASEEMKTRLRKLLDKKTVGDIMVGTFHSLCSRILRENYAAASLPKSFAILDTDGQEAVCRGVLKDLGLTKSAVKESAKIRKAAIAEMGVFGSTDPLAAAGAIAADELEDSGESNEFVTPSQCAKYIGSRKEIGEPPVEQSNITTRSTAVEQMEVVYAMYQERCAKAGLLDFQDLLTKTVTLLENDVAVRESYRSRFSSIMVDEFQDTNDIQYRWLELLKGENTHVMAVGDDYQSIYAFRGANPKNMFRFLREMATDADAPKGRMVKLEQNYRSLPHILETANAIIKNNTGQMDKTLFTTKQDQNEQIDLITFGNGIFEAESIARSIHAHIHKDKAPPSEIAVLYRTNQQSRLIEQELNKLGVPLTVYGGFRFFERQEVKLVLAYMDLVSNATHDLSFAKIANIPPRGIGERTIEELRQLARENNISMMEMIAQRSVQMAADPSSIGTAAAQKKHTKLEEFSNAILDIAELSLSQPLHVIIQTIVERFNINEYYLAEAGGAKDAQAEAQDRISNIAELVSAATQFELENEYLVDAIEQLPEYMAYVALMTSTSESDMSRKNTVSLMTVHSSKGLEFDHVFIAGLDEQIFPHNRAIMEDMASIPDDSSFDNDDDAEDGDGDGMQEERRLMYVAVTRARKTLVMTHSRERMINGEIKSYETSRFIDEIPTHRLKITDDYAQRRDVKNNPWASLGNQKRGSDYGNHEYGGDAFDDTRDPQISSASKFATPNPSPDQNTRVMAIIGTAGRDKDKPMTTELWSAMLADARKRVKSTDTLISGGAAWADHLAVSLYLEGSVKRLELHLPAPLINGEFAGPDRNSAASAANFYHDQFHRTTGVCSLKEIEQAILKGAQTTCEPEAPGYAAMFTRNLKVAQNSNAVLAYTFSDTGLPADGGTKDTWNKSKASIDNKQHVDLNTLHVTAQKVSLVEGVKTSEQAIPKNNSSAFAHLARRSNPPSSSQTPSRSETTEMRERQRY